MFIPKVADLAQYSPAKMGKSTLAAGEFLFAGLNAFEPGQEHALHSHEGQDKLYYVLEGSAEATVGESTSNLEAGDAAFAPSGVPHSIRNTGTGRLLVMAVLGPAPGMLKHASRTT